MTTSPRENERRLGARGIAPAGDGGRLSREEARLVVEDRLRPFLGAGLPAGLDLRRLSRYLTSRRYAAGDLIVRKGVRGDSLGVVAAGRLTSRSLQVPDREPSLLGPGAVFGEAMLLRSWPSDCTLRADTNAQIYFLDRSDLLGLGALDEHKMPPAKASRSRDPWFIWTAVALVVVLAAAGLRYGLGFRLPLTGLPAATSAPTAAQPPLVPVAILSPATGAVVERARQIVVRASVEDVAARQAELLVDGVGQGVSILAEGASTPWLAEWAWTLSGDGAHRLEVEALGVAGSLAKSEPVTVTVVPAGELLFASNRTGTDSVYAMRVDGRDDRPLTSGAAPSRQPAWGRHGRLAYVTVADGGSTEIWILDPTTTEARRLGAGRDPAWSMDGSRLAYAAGAAGTSQIFVTGGEATHQITAEAVYAGQPAWDPDGTRLAYAAERSGDWDIWIASLNRTTPARLTDDPAMDWAPAWSPDGEHLAFVSNRGGSHQVYVMRADGSDVAQLTAFEQGAESPAWSPDGNWIAFVAYVGDATGVDAREICLMRADGRDQVRLTHNSYDDSQPAWGAAR